MKTFTFFLDDESIHEIEAPDKDAAMRKLCDRLCRSWADLWPHILGCFAKSALDSSANPS